MERTRILKVTRRRRLYIRPPLLIQCKVCNREVEAIAAAEAAGILNIPEAAIADLLSAASIHPIPTITGNTLICKNSLFVSEPPES